MPSKLKKAIPPAWKGTSASQAEGTARRAKGERCHSHRDGDCYDKRCPQLRDGEPQRSGRHCPLDRSEDYDE